jgi:hypothetical protein
MIVWLDKRKLTEPLSLSFLISLYNPPFGGFFFTKRAYFIDSSILYLLGNRIFGSIFPGYDSTILHSDCMQLVIMAAGE